MQRFGEKLRTLRKRRGWTMQQLATEFGYSSRGTIADLESGRLTPSIHLTIKIARLFNVSTDQLLFDELNLD